MSAREAREDAQVVADALDAVEREPRAVDERRRRGEIEHRGRVRAEQARREIDEQLVDAALAQQRAVQLVARLDVQFVDAALAERGEHRGQIDLAAHVRERHDFRAARAQRLSARFALRVERAAEDEERAAFEQARGERDT